FSAFAGEVALLSPELLERDGLVASSFWAGHHFPGHEVDYARAKPFKAALLREAWKNFGAGRGAGLKDEFAEFTKREAAWLDDFALYTAIRESLGGVGLRAWPRDLLHRKPAALAEAGKKLADEVAMHEFGQFLFDR